MAVLLDCSFGGSGCGPNNEVLACVFTIPAYPAGTRGEIEYFTNLLWTVSRTTINARRRPNWQTNLCDVDSDPQRQPCYKNLVDAREPNGFPPDQADNLRVTGTSLGTPSDGFPN